MYILKKDPSTGYVYNVKQQKEGLETSSMWLSSFSTLYQSLSYLL